MYRTDLGGVFTSDTHRRVLGHLPVPGEDPMALHPLGHRISPDAHHGLTHVDELDAVLRELEADGLCVQTGDGWGMTDEGLTALCAPAPEPEPGTPVRPALLDGLEIGLPSSAPTTAADIGLPEAGE